ncbi:hypothetical protein HWV23_15930 [Natronomonas halophila]|uniref:hypothetical protein n=1 Tax=Natronomonas halophila TaxID=2747817 RepID=UPI0015B74047|nr:hypothetical protein [Natronomonas halophila]QLD87148.1 hypothetical protein HWV23_15930 [Natronomonas halophila]
MTSESPFDDVSSAEEFEALLGQLLLVALESSIDLEGSWVFRSDDGAPDFEVMVYELEASDDTEE